MLTPTNHPWIDEAWLNIPQIRDRYTIWLVKIPCSPWLFKSKSYDQLLGSLLGFEKPIATDGWYIFIIVGHYTLVSLTLIIKNH